MQVEIYNLTANEKQISIDLVAICDSFSSLLWDVEFYQCGSFEVYIAANPQNVEVFQLGRIVCRDDDIGKIRCGICGNVLRRYCSYGKYHYWYCPGKSKVRTECNAQDLADCNLRTVSAYIMGTEEFEAYEFAKQVKEIIVQKDGSLKYYFYDGSEKIWQKM